MNALGRAAQQMTAELEHYNIKVYMTAWRIEWVIPQGTWELEVRRYLPKWWYRRQLRKLIKIAKEYEGRL